MTFEIGLLIGLVVIALILFSLDWISADVVSLGLLVALTLTGLLPADRTFAGFGSDTVLTIFGLLIMTAALQRTGVMDLVGRAIFRYTGQNTNRLLFLILVGAAFTSSFMSNTAATAFFVPIVMGTAARARISPARLLLPLAFAAILASSMTLISTSTNLVVSGLLAQHGMQPMGVFELTPVGLPIAVVGIVYVAFIGRRLLPDRAQPTELTEQFGVRPYLSEILILPSSILVGKTLAESSLGRDLDLSVLQVIRGTETIDLPQGTTRVETGDVLLVEGRREEILKIKDTSGIELKADVKLSDPNLQREDTALAEVILLPGSPLIGRTLKGARFRERFGLQVLGLNREGKNVVRKISRVSLRMGDVLLVQGHQQRLARLDEDRTVRILNAAPEQRLSRRRALLAAGIFAGALLLGTVELVSLPVAVLLGAIAIFVTRCITPEEAYCEVEWKVIVLIGSMLGLGVAMQSTGTAKYLAGMVAGVGSHVGPMALLGGFFLLTVLLTQPMSNQAAAVVVFPIAVQTALHLGLNPRPFAMMVAIAASCSYLTPLEPACVMVYGPGRYRFMDFFRVGAPLTVIIFVIALVMVPWIWPLRGGG